MASDERALSLWELDSTIAQLLEMREELAPDHAQYPDEIKAIDAELARYIGEQLPAKVDGYIGIIRRDEAVADAAEAEAERLTAIAKRRRARVAYLKENALAVMQASGRKRLEGKTGGVLRVQANGGALPVVVTEPSLVPDQFSMVSITLRASDWRAFLDKHTSPGMLCAFSEAPRTERLPRLKDIAAELARPCPSCEGLGHFRATDDGDVMPDKNGDTTCPECDGSGHKHVPGAHLGERASHLRVE